MDARRPRSSSQSRRRYPRLEVFERVDGYQVPVDVALKVMELSTGGFSVRSTMAFPPGERHRFRFTTADDREVTIEATAVHCRLVQAGQAGQLAYVSGFEFVSSAASDEAVAVLVDTLSSVFSLE